MGKITTATEEQKTAAAAMIDVMRSPTRAPTANSWTLGWDVVCSYSEKNINDLLRKRHQADSSGKILKAMELPVTLQNFVTRKSMNCLYKINFGPPMLQFNARAQGEPMCSLTMEIKDGTFRPGNEEPYTMDEKGYFLKLNGIPLGAVKGNMVGGEVKAKSELSGGAKSVYFDAAQTEQAHVVLAFPMAESMTLTVLPDTPENQPNVATSTLISTGFQDAFRAYFTDPSKYTSLSYSIASINNTTPSSGKRDLEPTKFQFGTFTSEKADGAGSVTALSIFIEVSGGEKSGTTNGLSAAWQTQWTENKSSPIPQGFTASLILNASLVYNVMMKPAFESNKWKVTNTSENSEVGIKMKCYSTEEWYAGAEQWRHSQDSEFFLDSMTINLGEYPLELFLHQKTGSGPPTLSGWWELSKSVYWRDSGRISGLIPAMWGEGHVNLTWELGKSYNRKNIPGTAIITDTEFSLNFDLATDYLWQVESRKDEGFMSIADNTAIGRAQKRLSSLRPPGRVKGMGLGFLRTTNLLTPGSEVIDFNEDIGLKTPRDFVLVGEVLPV